MQSNVSFSVFCPCTIAMVTNLWHLESMAKEGPSVLEYLTALPPLLSCKCKRKAGMRAVLTHADSCAARAHIHAQRDRMRQRDGGEAAEYLQDVGSGQGQMRRPDKSSSSLSWRFAPNLILWNENERERGGQCPLSVIVEGKIWKE